jgi:serine/threonine protein kinase
MAESEDNTQSTPEGRPGGGDIPQRLGHYRIESLISSGGMGSVYHAYDESMKRHVALKVLHQSFALSETTRHRFAREAWIAGQLEHQGITRVYGRGEENGIHFFAMELADGGSLADYIKQVRSEVPPGKDVSDTIRSEYFRSILEKFIEIAMALEHVHEHGFVHRDIKPHNILLSGPDKRFKLTDFGIAHADDMTRMTRAGDFVGTIRYMSPELLTAHRAVVDKRTDIYSLGVTLYETLTLSLPYLGDSEERYVTEILVGRSIPARKRNKGIGVDLETVLMTAMQQDPGQRYQSAVEFAEDLKRVLDRRPIQARREKLLVSSLKYFIRNRKPLITAAILAIVFLTALIFGLKWTLSLKDAFVDKYPYRVVLTQMSGGREDGGIPISHAQRVLSASSSETNGSSLVGVGNPRLGGNYTGYVSIRSFPGMRLLAEATFRSLEVADMATALDSVRGDTIVCLTVFHHDSAFADIGL